MIKNHLHIRFNYFILCCVFSLAFISISTTQSYAQKKDKPPITKKKSKAALQDKLSQKKGNSKKKVGKNSKSYSGNNNPSPNKKGENYEADGRKRDEGNRISLRQRKQKKKQVSQTGKDYSGNNIAVPSKQGDTYDARKQSLKDKLKKKRPDRRVVRSKLSQKSSSFSGTMSSGKPPKRWIEKRERTIKKGRNAKFPTLTGIKPKTRRKQMSSRSSEFSGLVIPTPSPGQLAKRNREMNKEARKGMYMDLNKYKRMRTNMSYTSLTYSGNKHHRYFKVKVRSRPAIKSLRKRSKKKKFTPLPRMVKKKTHKGKYDTRESEIWYE